MSFAAASSSSSAARQLSYFPMCAFHSASRLASRSSHILETRTAPWRRALSLLSLASSHGTYLASLAAMAAADRSSPRATTCIRSSRDSSSSWRFTAGAESCRVRLFWQRLSSSARRRAVAVATCVSRRCQSDAMDTARSSSSRCRRCRFRAAPSRRATISSAWLGRCNALLRSSASSSLLLLDDTYSATAARCSSHCRSWRAARCFSSLRRLATTDSRSILPSASLVSLRLASPASASASWARAASCSSTSNAASALSLDCASSQRRCAAASCFSFSAAALTAPDRSLSFRATSAPAFARC
mmetsp:Transcript_20815/g.68812  ORF Transcript_20815/g.68812 Transcript_20815/m.68812 type:complete len:302 (+) Transcript_20815:652-1557(+)